MTDDTGQPINPYASPQPVEAIDQGVGASISFFEITSSGLQLYRRNLWSIVVVTMSVWVPLEFVESYIEYFILDPDNFLRAIQMRSILEGLFGIIAQGSVISIGLGDLQGERISWFTAMRRGLQKWPQLLWSDIVRQFCILIGLVLLVIPGLYLATKMSLYQCVAVNEGRSGPGCLKRSMELTKGAFVGFFILGIVTVLAFFLIGVIAQLPLTLIPSIDHWITYAISNLLFELVVPVFTLMYVASYWERARGKNGEARTWTAPSRSTKVVVSSSSGNSNWWES